MSHLGDLLTVDLRARLSADVGEQPSDDALARWTLKRFARIDELARYERDFESQFQNAVEERGRRQAIRWLAELLGARGQHLQADARSLNRFFDRDAVTERVRRRVGEEERALVFALDQIGAGTADPLASAEVRRALERAWSYGRDPRIREAGFRCLRRVLENGSGQLPDDLVLLCQSALIRQGETVWIQNEALTTLAIGAPDVAGEILRRRLRTGVPGEDIFVRRHAVVLLADRPELANVRDDLLAVASQDQSPAVRQKAAEAVWACSAATAEKLARMLVRDPELQVRAELLVGLRNNSAGRELLASVLTDEDDEFVLRVALHVIGKWAFACDQASAILLRKELHDHVAALLTTHGNGRVRGWAAAASERLWCVADPGARALLAKIAPAVAKVREGQTIRITGLSDEAARNGERLGRVLAVLAREDFGLEVLPGDRLRRGDLFGFRTWRVLHEWRNPGPDKRQAFRHWIGRIALGRLLAPSGIMAELAPTKVPGEPLFQPEEGNWRPWLPLPDVALSAIDSGGVVTVVTAEGVTEIRSPSSFFARIRARMALTWRFTEFAELRNWSEASGRPPSSYSEALRSLGVEVSFRPHEDSPRDPPPARFFSVGPAALGAVAFWQATVEYFDSIYANTLGQLWLFLALAIGWFFFNHLRRNRSMRQARQSLSVVVGGWGTRGKSGTERLKAAVFSALGHPLISKTTGNEAMFLHASAFGDVREMFLFRPYDKATIWEQLELAILAGRLGAKVFLWECMGLTPAYVKILQRHWMRDDIGTITNTYPDHEDVQGPAGRNIPEVMTNFIPEGALLITSEEQMRPILKEAARALRTRVDAVGWLEAGLIPQEFLTRFPYEEHPYNIALVTRMAESLGIAPDVAVKEMADRVVQDIGALKVYPEALVRTRRLEFVLGNSANERFGALGNWTRLGFDQHDPVQQPDLWITTVVNNRADRVPRSRVFASILVKDISADRHVLIGSNLEGLEGCIKEAWVEQAPSFTLAPSEQTDVGPLARLESLARRFRITHREDQLTSIAQTLRASGRPAEDGLDAHIERCTRQLAEYRKLEAELLRTGPTASLDEQLRQQLWSWFEEKIVVVPNFHATGEEIVGLIANMTPPGFRNRIMGMQNIKGTGLDFVYRWHAWEAVSNACVDAESGNPAARARGLRTLSTFREFGVLSAERVEAMVQSLRSTPALQGEIEKNQLMLIEAQLHDQLRKLAPGDGNVIEHAVRRRWAERAEAVLDAGDAIRRRKKANLIYRELAAERIGSDRAALELKKLTARQKGGWLHKQLQRPSEAPR